MTGKFELKQVSEQPTLVVRAKVAPDKIASEMKAIYGTIFHHVQQTGLKPAGPPFALYHSFSDEAVDFEAGIPMTGRAAGAGQIVASTLPAGTAAATSFFGPYDRLSEVYPALQKWMTDNGFGIYGACWEVYVTDPTEVADPAQWQTDIYWLVE